MRRGVNLSFIIGPKTVINDDQRFACFCSDAIDYSSAGLQADKGRRLPGLVSVQHGALSRVRATTTRSDRGR